MCFFSVIALPTPMLITIFSSRGSAVDFVAAQLLGQRRTDLLLVPLPQPRRHGLDLLSGGFGLFWFSWP